MAGQFIGEIFDRDFADKEFGKIFKSIEVKNSILFEVLTQSNEYLMFNIETGELRVLDGNRNPILGLANSNKEVFYRMSIKSIKLLLEKGKKETTFFEMRPNTLTLTNGNYTLERVLPCPPFCD
jgi:hypothetical protein